MKKLIRKAVATALVLSCCQVVYAQEKSEYNEYNYPHNFITLQGGAQATFTNYKFTDLLTPQFAISFGRYFTPEFGVRLHIQGYEVKGGFDSGVLVNKEYKFKAITSDLDALFNMSNILYPNRQSHTWNWILLAGFGVNSSWDYDEYASLISNVPAYNNKKLYDSRRQTFNGRLGTQLECSLSKNFALSFEVDANYKNDMFNLKVNDNVDWQVAAFVGLTYKFGMKKKPAPAPTPIVEETPAPAPTPVVKEDPKPAPAPAPVVEKDEPLKETFFYVIRESDLATSSATLDKIVVWCNKNPSKKITINGYADKGTGNAGLNAKYAKQRADKVAKALQDRGISADRMEVISYGDTVQPFADNDKNRCTIVIGE